jgi:hypothetical protein
LDGSVRDGGRRGYRDDPVRGGEERGAVGYHEDRASGPSSFAKALDDQRFGGGVEVGGRFVE